MLTCPRFNIKPSSQISIKMQSFFECTVCLKKALNMLTYFINFSENKSVLDIVKIRNLDKCVSNLKLITVGMKVILNRRQIEVAKFCAMKPKLIMNHLNAHLVFRSSYLHYLQSQNMRDSTVESISCGLLL